MNKNTNNSEIKIVDCEIINFSRFLLKEVLENLEKIIYCEYSRPYRMGVHWWIMIYFEKNNKIICYKTNFFIDDYLYDKTIDFFETKINWNSNFKYFEWGFWNHVFLNSFTKLEIKKDYFIYNNFKIRSSVLWVFSFIIEQLKCS